MRVLLIALLVTLLASPTLARKIQKAKVKRRVLQRSDFEEESKTGEQENEKGSKDELSTALEHTKHPEEDFKFFPSEDQVDKKTLVELVVIFDSKDEEHTKAREFFAEKAEKDSVRDLDLINGMKVKVKADLVQDILELENVVSVQENKRKKSKMYSTKRILGATPINANALPIATALPATGGNKLTSFGAGVTICVVDSGVNIHDTIPNAAMVGGYNACESSDSQEDDDGHGTHVASTALGRAQTLAGHGNYRFIGVASDASLYAVRVEDSSGDMDDDDIVSGMSRCIAQGADVINLSLGDDDSHGKLCNKDVVARAITRATAKNVIVTVASGNDGYTIGVNAPACGSAGISVGASTTGQWNNVDDNAASFDNGNRPVGTNFGTRIARFSNSVLRRTRPTVFQRPHVVAPGFQILAAKASDADEYEAMDGTSMATPHVSGLAAILKGECHCCTAAQIKEAIISGARRLGNGVQHRKEGAGEVFLKGSLAHLKNTIDGCPAAGATAKDGICLVNADCSSNNCAVTATGKICQ